MRGIYTYKFQRREDRRLKLLRKYLGFLKQLRNPSTFSSASICEFEILY